MHYFALLLGPESTSALTPTSRPPRWRHTRRSTPRPRPAIRAGDALAPSATGVRITGGPDAPTMTDGPFAESAEVAVRLLRVRGREPRRGTGIGPRHPRREVRRGRGLADRRSTCRRASRWATSWLALLLEPPANVLAPGTPEWERTSPQAPEVRRGRRRPRQRRRAAASAVDGDDGAGARRRGAADRRPLHRRRRGGQRLLHPQRRRPRRGRQGRVDDSGDDGRAAPTHWASLGCSHFNDQPGRRLSARMGPGRRGARPLVR